MRTPSLLLITDSSYSDDATLRVVTLAAHALPAGAFAVQLREKKRPDRHAWASRLRAMTRDLGVPLIVNGDVALAHAISADGIHFPSDATDLVIEAGRGLWRSAAAHDDAAVVNARRLALDAVLVSPVFATPGKGEPRGLSALTEARHLAGGEVRVLALGGVEPSNARSCYDAGADGVAVIRALLGASDAETVRRAHLLAVAV